jgi:hypothetical protein
MAFRRRILASLAPLLGLSAIVAAMAAQPGEIAAPQPGIRSLARLLRSVVQLTAPSVEYASVSARTERPSPHAALALSALVDTPLRGSVWMLRSRPVAGTFLPHLRHAPLRC